jgi:hypothetical protein
MKANTNIQTAVISTLSIADYKQLISIYLLNIIFLLVLLQAL